MKNLRNSIYALALIVLFSACEDKIDIDLSFAGKKPVVEGRVSTETDSSFVRLSFTAPYNSNEKAPAITNATVEVSKDNDPAVMFSHTSNGIYKAPAGFAGEKDHNYKLRVVVDGKEYTSESYLFPMFDVEDTLVQKFEPANAFLDEGYTITYFAVYNQKPIKYYWFDFGKNDTLENADILFDNDNLVFNQRSPFEIPFFRAEKGDSVMLLFRSIDRNTSNYIEALGSLNSGAPAIFQSPPANPPTNIQGDALGIFYAMDVVRRWRIVD